MAQNLCAVAGCTSEGKAQTCPHDGARHHHGRIHYSCGYPEHSLTFRKSGWHLICDAHYAIVARERLAFDEERRHAQSELSR